MVRYLSLALLLTGCLSPSSDKFVDRNAFPSRDWAGRGNVYRAWLEGGKLQLEVEQPPGFNVTRVYCSVRGGAVYLWPQHTSSGGGGRRRVEVPDSCTEGAPPDWPEHLYWITGELRYPITHPAYWNPDEREPNERIKVILTDE